MENKARVFDLIDKGHSLNTKGFCFSSKYDGKWKHTSIDEFKSKVRAVSLGLANLGVGHGDKVALHSENRTEWLIVDQAVLSLGAALVPIYTTQPGDQIKYIIENSESKVYFVSNSDLYDGFKNFDEDISCLKARFSFESIPNTEIAHYDNLISEGEIVAQEHPEKFEEFRSKVTSDDLATLIYTSGTTGVPKGVMLTHDCLASNVISSEVALPFDIEVARKGQIMSFLPLAHVFERMITYLYQYMGLHIYYVGSIDNLVADIQDIKPVCFATVPRVLEKVHAGFRNKVEEMSGIQKILASAALDFAETYDVSEPSTGLAGILHGVFDKLVYKKLRTALGGEIVCLISGGAALSPMIMNFFNALGIITGQGYGLTETSPVITVFRKDKLKAGSSGVAIPGVEVKIADDGEILARGRNVMKGYYKLPDATAEVLTEDGWFHTGDIGHLDKDGFLFITDRKKSLFKLSTGKYVAPQNIENKLSDHSAIEQVVVLGNGKKFCSAVIVPDYTYCKNWCKQHGHDYSDDSRSENEYVHKLVSDAVNAVNKELPHWEAIKKFVLLQDLLSIEGGELTPKMSIKRQVVTKKYADRIESMYV